MPTLLSPLRSWLKEEQRLLPQSPRVRRGALATGVLVLLLLGLEAYRRTASISADLVTKRLAQLELVSADLSDIRRTAFDWARWDDTLAFVQGSNPGYIDRDLAQTSLFAGGGVMVLFDRAGTALISYGLKGPDRATHEALQACAASNLAGLRSLADAVQLLCAGNKDRLFLGVLTQISNNDSSAPAAGSLVMFEPLIRPAHGPRLKQQLQALRESIATADAASEPLPEGLSLRGARGASVRLLPQSALPLMLISLRDDLLLGLVLLTPLLLIRVQLTLAHRRQRLLALCRQRSASAQIRRVCLQLDALLAQLGLGGDQLTAQQRVMARLASLEEAPPQPAAPDALPAGESGGPLSLEGRLDTFARRFQHFLDSAHRLALLDTLTQLPNRRYFVEQLGLEVQRHQQDREPIALLFVDIDRFKEINDSFGHTIGDRALVVVAEQLRSLIHFNDFLARYGGDEFVILHQLSAAGNQASLHHDSLCFAERIAAAFDGPVDLDGTAIELSLSLGITLLQPDLPSPEAAIRQCDMAMLQAKRNKHNRIAIFDLDRADPHDSDYELYTDLLQAIRDHQLNILFQPIVDANGQPRGVEALARWHHPRRGPIPPDQFLSLAERHRQILRLGDELLRQTLIGFSAIRQIDGKPLDLSFNISPSQLEDPSLVSSILHQLQLHRIAAERLTLELTERGILEGSAVVRGNLEQLRAHGIRLSLDDFGTGQSSLSLLSQLRPDEVKIDRCFVAAMEHDPYAQQIVTLLSRMAPVLGFQLVAEGVEDEDGFRRLRALGIRRFQGYWFARPLHSSVVDASAALPLAASA